jgi:hypothetical protein
MELREALAQISEIRQQMARTEVFRGYRAATVAFSGLVAVATAGVQSLLVPSPTHDLRNYLLLWVGAALLSILVFGIDQYLRYHRSVSPWQRDITAMAVEQFLPCLVAGATMTYVLVKFARDQSWMLPGLWSIIFSLGVFASRRLLHRCLLPPRRPLHARPRSGRRRPLPLVHGRHLRRRAIPFGDDPLLVPGA